MDPTETDHAVRSVHNEVKLVSDGYTSVSLGAGSPPSVHEGLIGATRNADRATETGKRPDLATDRKLTTTNYQPPTNRMTGNPRTYRAAASGAGRPDTTPVR